MKANVIWSRVWLGEQACGSALGTEQTWGAGRDVTFRFTKELFEGLLPKCLVQKQGAGTTEQCQT